MEMAEWEIKMPLINDVIYSNGWRIVHGNVNWNNVQRWWKIENNDKMSLAPASIAQDPLMHKTDSRQIQDRCWMHKTDRNVSMWLREERTESDK